MRELSAQHVLIAGFILATVTIFLLSYITDDAITPSHVVVVDKNTYPIQSYGFCVCNPMSQCVCTSDEIMKLAEEGEKQC